MVCQGIITKQTEPTPWVCSLTYPKKANGKLRICLNPKDLNKAIIHENQKASTLKEIAHILTGANKFSKMDGNKAFFGMHLTVVASLLTTFNTHLSRYRFLCVPFGLKMSQDIFQMRMDDIVAQCPGVLDIHYDVFIYGKDDRDHDANIINLFNRAQKGLIFNSSRCSIKQDPMTFFGGMFSANGYSPDPEKIQGITEMTPPQMKQELQLFLGAVNYLQTFIPHLSHHTELLCGLLEKENSFKWDENSNTSFQKIKSLLQKALLKPPRYYDRNKPVTLQCDASLKGLRACIIQDGHPIAFASKSLTDTETWHANIKRKLLAIIYGCEKFHTYLYGRTFTVETDHKLLEMISIKNLIAAPAMLQRMLLWLQQYDMTITYRPGKEMLLADALSHLPSWTNTQIQLDLRVDAIAISAFTRSHLTNIASETQWDLSLSTVHRLTLNGWPNRCTNFPRITRNYWDFHDELSIEDDLLMKGERVLMPPSCRDSIMDDLHKSHAGINKALALARLCVYRQGLGADVTDYIKRCLTCIECINLPIETLHPHEVPPGPWVKISMDFFQDHHGEKYLIIADYFTKFPYIFLVASTHHFKTINHLREKLHSWRHTCHCDILQWSSIQWGWIQKVCLRGQLCAHHIITSFPPVQWFHLGHGEEGQEHLQENWWISKCSSKTTSSAMRHPYLNRSSFSCWNSSWMTNTRSSHFKTLKTDQHMSDLAETHWNTEHTKGTVRQSTQSKASTSAQSEWTSAVLSQQKGTGPPAWLTGTVTEILDCGHSYMIQSPNGRVYRRNRAHLKPISYDSMSFQDQPVKKEEKQPEINSFQNPKPTKVKTVSFQMDTSYMDGRSIFFYKPNTHHKPPSSPSPSPQWLYSPRLPSYSSPASISSRESSVEPHSKDSSPTGRKRHQFEPAFIRPHGIDRGLPPRLSALL